VPLGNKGSSNRGGRETHEGSSQVPEGAHRLHKGALTPVSPLGRGSREREKELLSGRKSQKGGAPGGTKRGRGLGLGEGEPNKGGRIGCRDRETKKC
jgi:hypothetical protein